MLKLNSIPLKFVVEWRRLSRFPARMTLVHNLVPRALFPGNEVGWFTRLRYKVLRNVIVNRQFQCPRYAAIIYLAS